MIRAWLLASWVGLSLVVACSSSSTNDTNTDGGAAGTTASGGTSNGGALSGGAPGGGAPNGGAPGGGAPNGGAPNGGAPNGGAPGGGAPGGGAPNGGAPGGGGSATGGTGGAGGPGRVFVSAQIVNGAIGSAIEGDALCQTWASNLGGTWMAWLSDSTTSPDARFSKMKVPYHLVDASGAPNGPKIANTWSELTSGNLLAPIDRNQLGQVSNQPSAVWTGTHPNGTVAAETCFNWNSQTSDYKGVHGYFDKTDSTWTEQSPAIGNQPCNAPIRLYCFEQ
jgi:hypothetical protein